MVGPGCVGLQQAATASSQNCTCGRPGPPGPSPSPMLTLLGPFTVAGPGPPFCSTYPSMPGLGKCDSDAENLTCSKCSPHHQIYIQRENPDPDWLCLLTHHQKHVGVSGEGIQGQAAPPRLLVIPTPQTPGRKGVTIHWLRVPSEAESNDLQRASTAPSIHPVCHQACPSC